MRKHFKEDIKRARAAGLEKLQIKREQDMLKSLEGTPMHAKLLKRAAARAKEAARSAAAFKAEMDAKQARLAEQKLADKKRAAAARRRARYELVAALCCARLLATMLRPRTHLPHRGGRIELHLLGLLRRSSMRARAVGEAMQHHRRLERAEPRVGLVGAASRGQR